MADGRKASIAPRNHALGLSCPRNCLSRAATPVVSFSHHHDVLGKRLILDSTDRENHFLSRFENATVHNAGRNEGNLGTVRTINNSNPLRVNFLHHSHHLVGSPRAILFSFSISLGHWLGKRLLHSLFFPARRFRRVSSSSVSGFRSDYCKSTSVRRRAEIFVNHFDCRSWVKRRPSD